ncbi:hypothetical protein N180_15155 [Pedobacter antarcticus 4BY]|uniref:Iron complex transport system substrate-binding protein n=2 Tax=Pedobacter antarcticus TaxID=34086 RepID=A0A081PLP0_9SPHI|nr:hypothetical protein [Pedobacter antarcticus]KEQ31613.1 hypothetical protein N180_15155 [Pedobacter antarcticus 4BY]SFF35178.1 iron complex transport system substrate-binding protein [Pedobacter antarcticus]
MSFLTAVINSVGDESIQEYLQERVDIILHKIKFMEPVPVICLNLDNQADSVLKQLLEAAGCSVQDDPLQARILIYHQPNTGIPEMMGQVPQLLQKEWPAVEYNKVYLLEDATAAFSDPQSLVDAFEDIAEILYPGYFIFGNEGKTWMSFAV